MSHVTHLGYQADSCKQSWDPQSWCSDHVLAQARLTGLLRCMSNLVGMRQRRLDHVLAQACTGLLRCKGAVASFTTPKISLARSPEVADGCKFKSCAYTSICSCLMSLTWSKLLACCRLRLGSTGGHERSGLGGVYLSKCLSWAPYGMGGLWASSKTKGWWPGSRWGWGEYGVLTGPRSISPSLKKGMTRIDTIRTIRVIPFSRSVQAK